MRREAALGILLRTKVLTNGMLFGYHLNLCCGITMLDRLERAQFYIKRPYLRLPTLIAMLGASIQISVPLCFGIFKQQASVDVVKLESSFLNRVDRFGQPINQVSFNKGI
jgi:hypothetical protein